MPNQVMEMDDVADLYVKNIMNDRTYNNDITKQALRDAYSAHTGSLCHAICCEHSNRCGRLFRQPLPSIRFWRHFYRYLKRYHLFYLPSYCVGRNRVDAWDKVIQAYYFRNYDLMEPWRTESRNIRSPMPPFRESFPVESEWSALIGCSRDNDELDSIYEHFVTSDQEDTGQTYDDVANADDSD